MQQKPKLTTANWSISLDVECPECECDFDVFALDDSCDILKGMEPCQADEVIHLRCIHCEHEFEAKTVY